MSYLNTLNLLNTVTVRRTTQAADGMGAFTDTTTESVLSRAAIYQAGAAKSLISDKLLAVSTHVLACQTTDDVLFTDEIVYNSVVYEITGHPENVMFKDKVFVIPLKRVD